MARIIVKERGFETSSYYITGDKITFGRSKKNTVTLRNKFVSSKHCEISLRNGRCTITDLKSTNGLFVNGLKITSKELEDGDKILAGTALMIFVADEDAIHPERYVALLRDGEAEERELAAGLLGQFGAAAAVGPLAEALKNDPDSGVKAAAAGALGLVGDSRALEALLAFFDTPDSSVRNSVVQAIVRLADSRAVDGLTAYLKHVDKRVRVLAAHTLGQIHSREATEQLIKALDDDAFAVREAVVKALGDIADPGAAEALVRAANEPQRFPLVWVIESLGKTRSPESVRIILKAIRSNDAEVREAAADALGRLRTKEAAPALLKTLDDADPIVRRAAAGALEKLRLHLKLSRALADSSGSARKTVEISAIGDREGEPSGGAPKFGDDRSRWERWWAEQAED